MHILRLFSLRSSGPYQLNRNTTEHTTDFPAAHSPRRTDSDSRSDCRRSAGSLTHAWCSEPQTSRDAGWWIGPAAGFHKEIMRFTPGNLSIHHRPDVISTWQRRGDADYSSLIWWKSRHIHICIYAILTHAHGHNRMYTRARRSHTHTRATRPSYLRGDGFNAPVCVKHESQGYESVYNSKEEMSEWMRWRAILEKKGLSKSISVSCISASPVSELPPAEVTAAFTIKKKYIYNK